MNADKSPVSAYSAYLALDAILEMQRPNTDVHDEMLFIVVHQGHELWFKQLLHEFGSLQRELSAGEGLRALSTLHRSLAILKVQLTQFDALETMLPSQFNRFRETLGGSGFQSAQFREIEAVLGTRDPEVFLRYPAGSTERERIEAAMTRPCVFDSFLGYLSGLGYPVPQDLVRRDVSSPLESSAELQDVLLAVYRDGGVAAQVCERLTDLDQGVQGWRYRHTMLATRIIGGKPGTGGSAGAAYLQSTVFRPAFADLWLVRGEL